MGASVLFLEHDMNSAFTRPQSSLGTLFPDSLTWLVSASHLARMDEFAGTWGICGAFLRLVPDTTVHSRDIREPAGGFP